MLRGIDVSHHNGSVNWASWKSRYGLSWGAAKATEGTRFRDSRFAANWRGMKAAGLVRMAYHFAHPDSDPGDDARSFLAFVEANGGIEAEDIMVMDMEGNQLGLPMLKVRDWLAGWADIITRETGRKPFLYTGSGYITNNSTKDLKPHYAAWWFPRYPFAYDGKTSWPSSISGFPSTNNWGGAPDIWQFSQSFAGTTDANIANMTLADLKTRGRQDKPPASGGKPVAPSNEDEEEVFDMAVGIKDLDDLAKKWVGGDNDHDAQVLCWQVAAQSFSDSRYAELVGKGVAPRDALIKVKDELWPILRPLWG